MSLIDVPEPLTDIRKILTPTGGLVHFGAGTMVFEEGQAGDCAYMIEQGYVEIASIDESSKTVLAVLGPGEVFGEMSLLDGAPRSATATAMHESSLYMITDDQVQHAIEGASPLARLIVIASINRLRSTNLRHLHPVADPKSETRIKTKVEVDYAEVRDAAARNVRLRFELQDAIAQRHLELAYQPILSLANGRTVGFEALIRWPRPNQAPVSPMEFIPLAEDSGLIVPLGIFVLESGIEALNTIELTHNQKAPKSDATFVSVNVSPRQLLNEANIERLATLIEQTCLNPTNLKLEITEQTLMNDPRMAMIGLSRLKATGAKIAIDDFGTGYSSLNYLHRFPLDTLKIDRSFVKKIASDPGGQRVVSAIIGLAQDLDMDVVAEGIEHLEEFLWLQSRDCHFGQGYLMAKPMPLSDALTHVGQSFEW